MAIPQPAPQAQPMPAPKGLSSVVLAIIVGLAALIIALIYVYIFAFSGTGISESSRYWWSGFVGFIFALIFYMVHASIREEPITRIISGVFFALGALFFYAAILVGTSDPGMAITWIILLSVIVMIVLVLVWRMSVQREADEARKAARHRTP